VPLEGLEVVFLDIDNTLYDYERSVEEHVEAVRHAFPALGAWTPGEFLRLYWDGYARIPDEEKRALLRGSVPRYRRRVWDEILAPIRDNAPPVDDVTRVFSDLRDRSLTPNPGALEFVRRATAALEVGVISNGPGDLQRRKLRALGVDRLVREDLVFISHEVGCDKPARGIFRRALDVAGVEGAACLMVGDDPVCDPGSRDVGMRFALFAGKPGDPPEVRPPPDVTVRRFAELERAVFG